MKVEIIEYKGKKIIFSDCSNIKDQEEMKRILEEGYKLIEASRGKVLLLTDITKATMGPDLMSESKRLGLLHKDKIGKNAILGISGLKGLMLKGYNTFVKSENASVPFDTKEEALEYLVS